MRALALSLVVILTVMAASLLRSMVSCSTVFVTRPLPENVVAKIKLYLILAGLNAVVLLHVFNTVPLFHSGIMRSGLNAIMGPTGSGKTTYVRSLCRSIIYSYSSYLSRISMPRKSSTVCVCVLGQVVGCAGRSQGKERLEWRHSSQ